MNKVLYFPFIKVPQSEWFNRVLLYWDQVGSIVPFEFYSKTENLGKHMTKLIDADLVNQIPPSAYIYNINNFESSFISLIDNDIVIKAFVESPHTIQAFSKIHIEKMGDIADELVNRNLAKRTEEYSWYDVEEYTAKIFMTYLASVLGSLPKINMIPISDSIASFSHFTNITTPVFKDELVINELRLPLLSELLPAPSSIPEVNQLVKFKEKYSTQLISFRTQIEKFLKLAVEIKDEDSLVLHINNFTKDVKGEINEIEAKMKEYSWDNIILGNLCGIASAALPGAVSAYTGDIATAATAIPGLLNAIYNVVKSYPNRTELLNRPFAYSALVKSKLK